MYLANLIVNVILILSLVPKEDTDEFSSADKGRKRTPDVRIEEKMLKSVGFIAQQITLTTDEIVYEPYATGFCIAHKSEKHDYYHTYIVTAKHVVTKLIGQPFSFLVNKVGGGTIAVEGDFQKSWYYHPTDDTVDVAIREFKWNQEIYDLYAVPSTRFMTQSAIDDNVVGIGDEVAIMGLFDPASCSADKNMPILPIARHGNIAMMPTEKIQTDLGFTDAYLIEARSIGGISGSPVVVQETFLYNKEQVQSGEEAAVFVTGGMVRLFGMIHGHWDVRESSLNDYHITRDRRGVNMGIAIVIPAEKIMETLQHPVLTMARELSATI